jgi:hypothetical protein
MHSQTCHIWSVTKVIVRCDWQHIFFTTCHELGSIFDAWRPEADTTVTSEQDSEVKTNKGAFRGQIRQNQGLPRNETLCSRIRHSHKAKSSVVVEKSRRSARAVTYRPSKSSSRTRLTRLELHHGCCINALMMSIMDLQFCICSRFKTVDTH